MVTRFLHWCRAMLAQLKHGPPPKRIAVSPLSLVLARTQSVRLVATIYNAKGDPMPTSPTSWVSDNPAVAAVDQTGLVTAVAPGSAGVTALFDELVSNVVAVTVAQDTTPASIVVTPGTLSLTVGQTTQLTATITNKAGLPV